MIPEIGTSLGSIMMKKIINDSLPKLDVRRFLKTGIINRDKNNQNIDNRISKSQLLLPIARFYELPYFDIDEPTMDKVLLNSPELGDICNVVVLKQAVFNCHCREAIRIV